MKNEFQRREFIRRLRSEILRGQRDRSIVLSRHAYDLHVDLEKAAKAIIELLGEAFDEIDRLEETMAFFTADAVFEHGQVLA